MLSSAEPIDEQLLFTIPNELEKELLEMYVHCWSSKDLVQLDAR